jgi:hypothetical protein
MKKNKLKDVDFIAIVFIVLALIALLVPLAGCNHGFYLQGHKIAKANDPRQCCQRLSLHQKEMEKFTRYCKVALFLHRGDTINDKKVKELSHRAVNVCKFVFGVQTEEQLLSVSDLNEGYHKVRHYIIKPDDVFWRHSLPCDPAEPACEEF